MVMWQQRFKGGDMFLSAFEFGDRRPTFTIARISTVKVEDERKKKEVDRPVIYFKEIERAWIYNKQCGFCLSALWGNNDDAWIGKRVTLYADYEVKLGADQVSGIRVAGSPDITKPVTVRIKFPKKKAFEVTLVPTGKTETIQTNKESTVTT